MAILDPTATSVSDICTAALQESGAVGFGQTPIASQITDAQARLQWMLQEWARKRWFVYCLVNILVTSTGALSYSVGPSGDFDTGANSSRPDKIEAAFLRQLTQSQPNQIDYPLELLQSKEDYDKIALKSLVSFPTTIFYDPTFPLGTVYVWPVAQASIYGICITVKTQLPTQFANTSTTFVLPYEYFNALVYNLAIRLRARYQIPTFPGDSLPGLAKNSRNVLRGANTAIARLSLGELARPGLYNIFNDRFY